MNRVVVYGFHHPDLSAAVGRLRQDRRVQVNYWIGAGSSASGESWDADIVDWHLNGPAADGRVSSATRRQLAQLLPALQAQLPRFVDQVARHPCCDGFRPGDYADLWALSVARSLEILDQQPTDTLLLQNVPHEGFELALYCVARQLGIATLVCYQSLFPGRFFYCRDLDDFGRFDGARPQPLDTPPRIERRFQKDLFYMQPAAGGPRPNHLARAGSSLRRWFHHRRQDWQHHTKWWKQRWGIDRLRRRGCRPQHPEQAYRIALRHHSRRSVSLGRDFVYFPLHLQPELTTSGLGGRYADQLLAVEQLRRMLPARWWIYVKENPKQTYRWRGGSFFQRLAALPRTVLVDPRYDTYRLMHHARFVATITGTAGWEAITGGKNALVFGQPWYLALPGVWHIDQRPTVDALVNSPIDHHELQRRCGRLLERSRKGVVDNAYAAVWPEYSPESNTRAITAFLEEQLAERGSSDRAAAAWPGGASAVATSAAASNRKPAGP